jgi:hypothetical protein
MFSFFYSLPFLPFLHLPSFLSSKLQRQFTEMEQRYDKMMIANSQLNNEKQVFSYCLSALKDDYDDLEDNFYELQRELKAKNRVMSCF